MDDAHSNLVNTPKRVHNDNSDISNNSDNDSPGKRACVGSKSAPAKVKVRVRVGGVTPVVTEDEEPSDEKIEGVKLSFKGAYGNDFGAPGLAPADELIGVYRVLAKRCRELINQAGDDNRALIRQHANFILHVGDSMLDMYGHGCDNLDNWIKQAQQEAISAISYGRTGARLDEDYRTELVGVITTGDWRDVAQFVTRLSWKGAEEIRNKEAIKQQM